MKVFKHLPIAIAYKIDQVFHNGIYPLRVIPFHSDSLAPRDEGEEVSDFDKTLRKLDSQGVRYVDYWRLHDKVYN